MEWVVPCELGSRCCAWVALSNVPLALQQSSCISQLQPDQGMGCIPFVGGRLIVNTVLPWLLHVPSNIVAASLLPLPGRTEDAHACTKNKPFGGWAAKKTSRRQAGSCSSSAASKPNMEDGLDFGDDGFGDASDYPANPVHVKQSRLEFLVTRPVHLVGACGCISPVAAFCSPCSPPT